jgi:hypothetical protein
MLSRRGMICMGLYRRGINEMLGNRMPYVYTNPPHEALINRGDLAFVMCSYMPEDSCMQTDSNSQVTHAPPPHTHTRARAYTHTHTHTDTHIHIQTHPYTHTRAHIDSPTHIHTRVHTHIHTHTRTHTHTHTHTHIHRRKQRHCLGSFSFLKYYRGVFASPQLSSFIATYYIFPLIKGEICLNQMHYPFPPVSQDCTVPPKHYQCNPTSNPSVFLFDTLIAAPLDSFSFFCETCLLP